MIRHSHYILMFAEENDQCTMRAEPGEGVRLESDPIAETYTFTFPDGTWFRVASNSFVYDPEKAVNE